MKTFRITLALIACGTALFAQRGNSNGNGNGNGGEHVRGRLVAQLRDDADAGAVDRALSNNKASRHHTLDQIKTHVLDVPEESLDEVQAALQKTGLFTFVERDGIAHGGVTPNDPYLGTQWHLGTIQALSAWDISTGSTSVPIAIIDSGVDSTHPDLASKIIPGWNFVAGNSNTADDLGHGTAVAGSAAAATDNITGISGVVWKNPIMPLVVLDSTDYASYSNIASAITYAADHGVRVMNISIGGSSASSTLQNAVNYAWSKGALIFAAAMNNGNSTPMYPAACDNVIAVSATVSTDTLASYSSFGTWVDLSAPGDYIYTTNNGGGYGYWSGTSFASPISAAVAALVLSIRPSMTNTAVLSLLEKNSDDLGDPGYDQYYGWGRINAYKAAAAALSAGGSSDTTPPGVTISSPSNNATVSGMVSVKGSASDNVGVSKIEFYVDSQLVSTAVSSPFAFSWDTTKATNGSHSLTVKAYDAANNGTSAGVSESVNNFVVADSQAPSVTITMPKGGTVVGNAATEKITVSATDNVDVTRVTISIDGVQVYSGSVAPYAYSWNTKKVTKGAHVITASAWDAAGNMGIAAPVTVSK